MSILKQNLISKDKYKIKCPYNMNPIGVSIHNTYNDASAKNEVSYMHRNNNEVSFHIAVDDIESIQALPLDRNSWSCGDGQGNGNRKHISIEICYSKNGGDRFKNAEQRAAKVVAELLKKYGWEIDMVKAHRDFAKKDCPHRTNMDEFKNLVKIELSSENSNNISNTNPSPKFKNGDYSGKKARVTASVLNVRYDRGTNHKVIAQLKNGHIVGLNYCLNKWVSIDGFKGSKGLGYVHTDYLELI